MKILSLTIDGYKMFNPSPKIKLGKDINLLIGVNGSGKSTVLEAIAIIFAEVNRYCEDGNIRERQFNFSIEYSFTIGEILETTSTTQNHRTSINHVILTSSRNASLAYSMAVNEKPIRSRKEMIKYIPDNLIFYYSGFCENLEHIVTEIFDERADKLYKLRNQENIQSAIKSISKSIIYIKQEYFPLLFLLNFIDATSQRIPLTDKSFQIYSIQFHLQKPLVSDSSDYKNFYNIRGFLRNYLDILALSSQEIKEEKEDNTKQTGSVLTIEYHRSIFEAIEELPDFQENGNNEYSKYYAFHFVCLLFHIGILKEISVTIRDQNGIIYNINDLSEGEQQLITIDAIDNVLCKGNTILFFDEPDAFLHPQRQREILPFLMEKFDNRFTDDYVQLIASTHSPFVALSVPIESIAIFYKDGKEIQYPIHPIASYPAISSELFFVESEFSKLRESEIGKFKEFKYKILNNEAVNKVAFLALVKNLIESGSEVETIIIRELNQLKRLKNFNFENGTSQ